MQCWKSWEKNLWHNFYDIIICNIYGIYRNIKHTGPSEFSVYKLYQKLQLSTEYTRSIFFFIQKNNKCQASIGQHSRSKWFSEEKETSLLGQNKNKSIIIQEIQRWSQATKLITTKKNCINHQGRSPAVPTTATCKNDKECQKQKQQSALHTPQIPLSPSQWKAPATKTGRIIQPNNLLKVITDNVQSLSP